MNKIFDNINFTLEQWGLWAAQGVGAAGYGCSMPSDAQASNDPYISDDDALKVDKAVCALHNRHKSKGNAVVIYYRVQGCDYSMLAQRLGCSLFKAKQDLHQGVKFVDGFLAANDS